MVLGLCFGYDPIIEDVQLVVGTSAHRVCVGTEVTMTLCARDYDYDYPWWGWDGLRFSGWPGDEPQNEYDIFGEWTGSYHSEWTNTYNEPGIYEYDITADDMGLIHGDPPRCPDPAEPTHDACRHVEVRAHTLALDSPTDDMQFIVGADECDIAVVATVAGYYPPSGGYTYSVKWWVRHEGGSWIFKGNLNPVGQAGEDQDKFVGRWNTDYTERGNWDVKVELWVHYQQLCSAQTASIFCAKPTWPICADGQYNGYIYRWLHGTGSNRGVDVDITGGGCSGTAPLLASEDGTATPHQFVPTVHFCESMKDYDCLCNRVDYGSFNVELLDEQTPTYELRTLANDHWHMMPEPERTQGAVSYHQSLGNGGYTGNVSGSHDHFITLVGGTGVSPDRTGAVEQGDYTNCDQQLHPAW